MNDAYLWWLLLVGAVVMLAVIGVFAARLPRSERDIGEDERRAEAAWIGETIERSGGVAPTDLVEEVLELHAEYLATPRLARIPDRAQAADAIMTPGSRDPGTVSTGPITPPPAVPPASFAPWTVSGPTLPPPIAPPPPLARQDRTPPPPR